MKSFLASTVILAALIASAAGAAPLAAHAQQNLATDRTAVDPANTGFRIVVCDGPAYPGQPAQVDGHTYVPCDFNGAMKQIQHLIDIMMVLGVLVATGLFCYAGYLYVSVAFTGKEGNIDTAKEIFRKTFIGFAIMLCGWFIVFQILSWLTDNAGFRSLLGGSRKAEAYYFHQL